MALFILGQLPKPFARSFSISATKFVDLHKPPYSNHITQAILNGKHTSLTSNLSPDENTSTKPLPPAPNCVYGVDEPPSAFKKNSFSEKIKNWFNKEKRKERWASLMQDYKTSYFQDHYDLRKTGVKLWEASTELIKADVCVNANLFNEHKFQGKAKFMPNINGRSLVEDNVNTTNLLRGKTSVVTICCNAFGEGQIRNFVDSFLETFHQHPRIQLMQLNLQGGYLKSLILLLMIPHIRKRVDPSLHSTYIIKLNKIKHICNALTLNTTRGYVFIVDEQCKIRWAAHGHATRRELETLRKLLEKLDERNQTKNR
ncbi:hypothetical protein G9A89_006889 [Geosiphon pyriformis]|nr:hypothetical protein G9A89_006889 [Geosiphon pyriformis]